MYDDLSDTIKARSCLLYTSDAADDSSVVYVSGGGGGL